MGGYASTDKQAALQLRVTAVACSADAQVALAMHPRAGAEKAFTDIDTLFKTIDPLFTTTSGLTIRPVAFPSAVMCLATVHKLLILLTTVEPPDGKTMEAKKDEW